MYVCAETGASVSYECGDYVYIFIYYGWPGGIEEYNDTIRGMEGYMRPYTHTIK